MKVLNEIIFYDVSNKVTTHKIERDSRLNVYAPYMSTTFTKCFRVDKQHINGGEIHCINKYGLVYIYNYNSKKLITVLNPRPKQIKRYYCELNIPISDYVYSLINLANERNINEDFNNM